MKLWRSEVVQLRVSPQELKEFKKYQRMVKAPSLSEAIRRAIQDALTKEEEEREIL